MDTSGWGTVATPENAALPAAEAKGVIDDVVTSLGRGWRHVTTYFVVR